MKPKFIIAISLLFMLLNSNLTAQIPKSLDSVLSTLVKREQFNGCVIVAENGKPVYRKAFGYADFNSHKLLDNETVFELASVSKQFTAMAIMQLHQNHKLGYTDKIIKYFPQLAYPDISINDLLHHTSGLPEFLGWDERMIDTGKINTNQDILSALIKHKPELSFRPGEHLAYSNTNYVLLALLVEKLTGLTFSNYMNKYVFMPAGMSNTRVISQTQIKKYTANYATGHVYNPVTTGFVKNFNIQANRYQHYFDAIAGPYGISSNTDDLLKWDKVLNAGLLVSKQEQQEAYKPYLLNNNTIAKLMSVPYGFGWLVLPPNNITGQRYIHTGGYTGYMTIVARYPEKGKTIIILMNTYNVVNIYQLGMCLENILFGKPYKLPSPMPFKKSIVLSPAQLQSLTGSYTVNKAPSVKIIISNEANQLYAQFGQQQRAEVYAESETDFFYTIVNAKLKFIKDSTGVKVILFQNGQQLEATKL